MADDFISDIAREDFSKARKREFFSKVLHLFHPEKTELLSLDGIRDILKPKGEVYRGVFAVPLSAIAGSEGRYRDFNRAFLPKHSHMRNRWVNMDKAQLKNIVLPPVKLYEIGGLYFVRDGNHRVSVAKIRGAKEIDAEVVSLTSDITLPPDITVPELEKIVIRHERDAFYQAAGFENLLNPEEILFTSPGRYDVLLSEILLYKGGLDKGGLKENNSSPLTFQDAAFRWYKERYLPAVDVLTAEEIPEIFPKRTHGDLYVWIAGHRELVEEKYGNSVSLRQTLREALREALRTAATKTFGLKRLRIRRTIISLLRGSTGKFR